jgi:hypothetical protein
MLSQSPHFMRGSATADKIFKVEPRLIGRAGLPLPAFRFTKYKYSNKAITVINIEGGLGGD